MTNQEKLEKYSANTTKITVLKNKIANIESCEEILSTEVGTNGLKAKKYKTQYPFFKRTAGASGCVDTGSFYGFNSLEQKEITGSNPKYQVIRTLVPRTYTDASGSLVTTIPNGNSATNAVYNWAEGEKGFLSAMGFSKNPCTFSFGQICPSIHINTIVIISFFPPNSSPSIIYLSPETAFCIISLVICCLFML